MRFDDTDCAAAASATHAPDCARRILDEAVGEPRFVAFHLSVTAINSEQKSGLMRAEVIKEQIRSRPIPF